MSRSILVAMLLTAALSNTMSARAAQLLYLASAEDKTIVAYWKY